MLTRSAGVGDAVAGFAEGAIACSEGAHPDVAYTWYVSFLDWIRDTAHPVLSPVVVAVGELLIGLALIVGIAAILGATLNFSFVFAGSAGVNPAMINVSGGSSSRAQRRPVRRRCPAPTHIAPSRRRSPPAPDAPSARLGGPDGELSEREIEVLQPIASDLTNAEIAKRIFGSVRNIEAQRAHIHQKLDVHTRAERVRLAHDKGLLGDDTGP